ncbi:MAG: M48 family metallopeptidase [Acidobacteria bacterium]|nr:M48 family metallopeptidase [Acidobacteriota bacterium]
MKRRATRAAAFPSGARIFQRMFTRLGCQGRPPRFLAEFYPYANLTHTIRLLEDTAHVRLSDVFRDAPLAVLEATAAILLARVYRRRAAREFLETYREFALHHGTRRRVTHMRRKRARRALSHPHGAQHNLELLFEQLNSRHFAGKLRRPRLGWSARPWRTQLGCFDPALDQIVLSSRLDREFVPQYVVEYVLFHEMLHVKHPIKRASCGLQSHSAEFRRQEKRFPLYDRARRFLNRLG